MGSARRRGDQSGFTVIEVVVAMGIAAIAFAALAALLLTSLKALAVQKARTQGNEVATQGIEDLQRLRYNDLGLCGAPSGPTPAGLSDTVLLPNCSGATRYAPCGGTPIVGAVADEEYDCSRLNITFRVRRYVAFGDIAHTQKRLAVFVKWTDSVGEHEVSQQSSLRIPNRSAVIGLPPPSIQPLNTTVSPTTISLGAGNVTDTNLNISTRTTGLNPPPAGDSLVVAYTTLEGGQPAQRTLQLTTSDGTDWSGSIPAGTPFGEGQQFLTFTAIRKADGKVGSFVYTPAVTFVVIPPAPTPASITSACVVTLAPPACDPPPATIRIDGSGGLKAPTASFSVSVTTSNVSTQDSLVMILNTQTGAVSIALLPGPYAGGVCDPSSCTTTWTATVDQGAGYLFLPGPQRIYFTAIQGTGPNPVDVGTTAAESVAVELAT